MQGITGLWIPSLIVWEIEMVWGSNFNYWWRIGVEGQWNRLETRRAPCSSSHYLAGPWRLSCHFQPRWMVSDKLFHCLGVCILQNSHGWSQFPNGIFALHPAQERGDIQGTLPPLSLSALPPSPPLSLFLSQSRNCCYNNITGVYKIVPSELCSIFLGYLIIWFPDSGRIC